MRNIFIAAILLINLSAAGYCQEESVEETLIKLEQSWVTEGLKGNARQIAQIESSDLMTIAPHGTVRYKKIEDEDLKFGAFKAKSWVLDDFKVIVTGDAALVTGRTVIKNGWYYGQNISGQYRFTHFWVKRDGRWQVTVSQATPIIEIRGCNIARRKALLERKRRSKK